MSNSLGALINLVRRSKHTNQSEVNALKLKFVEVAEGVQKADTKIAVKKIREVLLDTITGTVNTPDVDENVSMRESAYSFIMKPSVSTHTAYPVTHTTTGTIDFDVRSHGTKWGAEGLFDGSQYITIPHHADIDVNIAQTFFFFFKAKSDFGGTLSLFCKKDESTSTNAGIHIYIESAQGADYDTSSGNGYLAADYQDADVDPTINCHVADGTNEVTATESASGLWDGNWHSIVVVIGDVGADYNSTDYQSADYSTIATETISIYMDGALLGSSSNTTITGTVANSRDSYFGGRDNAGVIDQQFKGYTAWFFWEGYEAALADASSYNSGQLNSQNQKSAIHFVGDEEVSDFNTILT